MKKLLLIPSFLGLLMLFSFTESSKSQPEWYTGESKKDPKLTKNESSFHIHFSTSAGELTNDKIVLSINGNVDTLEVNNTGEINLKLKPGKYQFQFFYNNNFFEIKTDSIIIKGGYSTPLFINFMSAITPVIADKPVIYVYPQDTMQININLDLKGEIGFTYPLYDLGWNFTAYPDGKIKMNNKEYSYLFWDGTTAIDNNEVDWSEGFIVEKDSLVSFFETNLKLMGLNAKEIDDYITYWCPRMIVNEKNYIHFMFNEDYNEYATLDVTPAPDKMFRVFMLWTKSEGTQNTNVNPQAIEGFNREGFTIVEWGGAEMPKLPVNFDAQAVN